MSLYNELPARIAAMKEATAAAQAIAEQIAAELACDAPSSRPLRLVLQVDVDPRVPFGQIGQAIGKAVHHMHISGLQVQQVGVSSRGLGEALIDALRGSAALGAPVLPIPSR